MHQIINYKVNLQRSRLMGNQDTKQKEDCVMMPIDCRMNDNIKEFQQRNLNENHLKFQKQKRNTIVGGKGIKNLSGRKFKQKTTPTKRDNMDIPNESRSFDIKMQKAQKLFKSLHVVKKFQSKYSKEYPSMIVNKSPSMRNLRQEIKRQKQNHKYFIPKEQLSFSPQQKPKILNQLIHHHFTVIQKVQWLLIRISQTGRHSNVLKIIKQMDNEYSLNESKEKLQEIYCFAKYIDALNIELMDMLYFQLYNSKGQYNKSGNQQLIQEQKQQINTPNMINVKEEIMKNKQGILSYESCKEKGWEIYKSNQVCFYILAVESQKFIPQLEPLELPQNLSILEIILEKYDAFAQMIQASELSICILIDEKRKSRFHKLMQQSQHKWKRLNIRILLSDQLPVLDIEGNFIFTHEHQAIHTVRMSSIGSGDLWNCLKDDFDEVSKFQYVQVIGVRNCLQSGFDCFLLGKSKEEGFEWAVKVFEPVERWTELRFMSSEGKQSKYIDFSIPQQPIISPSLPHYMLQPHEIDYPNQLTSILNSSKPFYVYGNHTLLQTKFIKRLIQRIDRKQQRMYRKKLLSEGNQKYLAFQRDFIDDVICTNISDRDDDHSKWAMFVCEREGGYYPLQRADNEGVFDIQGCSRTLSLNYLSQLNLSISRFLSLTGSHNISCYIDPHVSLQGQGLEDISLQIERRVNAMLVEKNQQLDERIESIQTKYLANDSHAEQYPTTASRVVASISRIAILQQQILNSQKQQITIFVD